MSIEVFNHSFNDKNCAKRLLREYTNYDKFIIGVDFDNTIKPVNKNNSCKDIIELLQRCSKDPKIIICLWTICSKKEDKQRKLNYCKSLGIRVDYFDESPFKIGDWNGNKQYFNILLDDRAGLESAYNNLKYVLDNANIKFD